MKNDLLTKAENLLKRRRRKRLTALIGLICAILISVLTIFLFTGRTDPADRQQMAEPAVDIDTSQIGN